MTRTQHWALAVSIFISLLLIGIVASLTLKATQNAEAANQTVLQDGNQANLAALGASLGANSAVSSSATLSSSATVNNDALSEAMILQKASEILPAQTPTKIQKVNYQGVLAYEITTLHNQLYLSSTGQVLAITNQPQNLQVANINRTNQGGYGQEDEEEGEYDD